MAARLLLARSKTLATSLSGISPASQLAGHCLRSLPSLQPVGSLSPPAAAPSATLPLSPSKVIHYGATFPFTGSQVLPRWFCTSASPKPAGSSSISKTGKTVMGMVDPNPLTAKQGDASKVVTAFSPLEATLAKERKTELAGESTKLKRLEMWNKVTYALIPALLIVSTNNLFTSLLVLSVYWHIYVFNKEVLVDYVHHEVTRKWVLIYFKLLLLILAKDTIVYFDLV